MKNLQYIFCRNLERNVQLLLNIFFVFQFVFFVFQCFLKNVRLLLKAINERLLLKENLQLFQHILRRNCAAFYMTAPRNISMFFNKRAAVSKRYQ